MTNNQAAWLTGPQASPLKVDNAPMPVPDEDQVVIRNHAAAINPVDWAMQAMDIFQLQYPFVMGCDAAGEISAVGSAVQGFKIGDRVIASLDPVHPRSSGGFQLYIRVRACAIAKIPDEISYADASVLPLAISTAASALFQKDTLNLPVPHIDAKPTGKVVLVWGGGSSIGACAIQLVVGAGFEVATTASGRNLDHCKALGAKYVFDYNQTTVVEDIVTALKGKGFGGAFSAIMDADVYKKCGQIASRLGGRQFVSTVNAPAMPLQDGLPNGVGTSNVWGTGLLENEVGPAVWGKWVPAALKTGALKCAPPAVIYGQGLDAIQGALGRWREGVSYQKVVVEL